MVNFPEASVHHFSMSILDHYLLALFLRQSQPRKLVKKHFLFEVVDKGGWMQRGVWGLLRGDLEFKITNKLKRCQDQLQRWN